MVTSERRARLIIHRTRLENLGGLVSFLLNDCCDEHPNIRACCEFDAACTWAGITSCEGAERTKEMTMKGVFIVRAEVPEADRAAFEDWYQNEHLKEAEEMFKATGAWRGWSRVDSAIHMAFYEFASVEAAAAIQDSKALQTLIGKFNKVWGDRVSRTREVIAVAG